jgi:outer membrane immunogenic protein
LRKILNSEGDMKKAIVASLAVIALGGSAIAADMGIPPPAYKPPPPPPPSWTGCYISAGWGYGMLDDERATNDSGIPNSTSAAKGWMGIFGGGCDYQFNFSPIGPIVVGAFADYDLTDIKGDFGDPFNDRHNGTQNERDAWYAGARAGVLITPNLLTYIDGGGTGAQINRINIVNAAGAPVDGGLFLPSENATGWFIGSGTEYAFTWLPINGLFWKTEYRFASYENYDQHYIHPSFIGSSIVHNSVDVQTITTSLVWRFNWTGH